VGNLVIVAKTDVSIEIKCYDTDFEPSEGCVNRIKQAIVSGLLKKYYSTSSREDKFFLKKILNADDDGRWIKIVRQKDSSSA